MKRKNYILLFSLTIILILISIKNAMSQKDTVSVIRYYSLVSNKLAGLRCESKSTFNSNKDYFVEYIDLLKKETSLKFKFKDPSHCPFEIHRNDGDIYRLNLIVFNVDRLDSKKQLNLNYKGIFNTKALISFCYIERNGKGYLLLANKFIKKEDEVMSIIISSLNEYVNNDK